MQGFLNHRHCFEHSATLMLINSFQIHIKSLGSKVVPTASSCLLMLCRSLSASTLAGEGEEEDRRGSMVPSRAQCLPDSLSGWHSSFSLLGSTTSIHVCPRLEHRVSPCTDKHYPQSKTFMTPGRSVGGKNKKTPPFQCLPAPCLFTWHCYGLLPFIKHSKIKTSLFKSGN